MEKSIYVNGDAEAVLLRKLRPLMTVLASIVIAYAVVGMPLPHDVSVTFAELFREFARVTCIGAVGALMAVWIGGYNAPKVPVSSKWAGVQIAQAIMLLIFLLAAMMSVVLHSQA